MSTRRRALLLLPSPLGPVEYEVLEDFAYLGPGRAGAIQAAPTPFGEACAVVAATDGGFVVRALPGEAAPTVDGAPAEERPLAEGARIGIGDRVVIFRAEAPRAAAAAASTPATGAKPPRTTGDAARRPRRTPAARPRANPWTTGLGLAGAVLLLAGLARAVSHLTAIRSAEEVRVLVPDPPTPPAEPEASPERSAREYEELRRWETENPDDLEGIVARYRDFLRRHAGTEDADRARARVREVVDEAGRRALEALDRSTESWLAQGDYEPALSAVRAFERRFGGTPSGAEAERLRRHIRAEAEEALRRLLEEVGPQVVSDPRTAHGRLLAATASFPPDLAGELVALMERALELMRSQGAPPPEPRRPPPPAVPPAPPAPGDGAPGDGPPGDAGPGDGSPRDPAPGSAPPAAPGAGPPHAPGAGPDGVRPGAGEDAEAEARRAWTAAREHLLAGRYREALDGYLLLTQRYATTEVCRRGARRLEAGRLAARAGVEGPAALFSVPVERHGSTIEVEYLFDDATVVDRDFTVEQPFPSDRPVDVRPERGAVHMEQVSGLFHKVVWTSDVRIEVEATAEVPHDFGLMAMGLDDQLRAILLNLANTRFRLKKGPAARVDPGHHLWFLGQGAWADNDPDAIGYIKIAHRAQVALEAGDRVKMEMIRHGNQCEGGFQGHTDSVQLQGTVRGDDGGTMGSARLGVFTNTGALVVHALRIRGKVDMEWFRGHLAELVAEDRGPP